MKRTVEVTQTQCDRCGGAPCVQIAADILAIWRAAGAKDGDTPAPDLCKRCVERILALAEQILTQRRRTWSEREVRRERWRVVLAANR